MTVTLVLGGAGFIGSNLVRTLVAAGERPRILTRPSFTVSNIQDILDRVDLIYGDFMDDVLLRRATENVTTVFHLISTTFPSMTVESSVYDILSNLLPTIRLAEICQANGVQRIVYASSGGTVYGEPQAIPIPEDHPLVPKSAYGQSKLTIENYLNFYARTTSLSVNILRLSNPYGPGQNPVGVQGIVAVAMCCAREGRTLNIYGTGEAVRDYVYIDDVVQAMRIASEKPGSPVVNISSGKGHSVMDIVRGVEQVSGCLVRRRFVPARPGDVQVNVLSNRRAYELYGWQPHVGLKEGLSRTWEWMTGNSR